MNTRQFVIGTIVGAIVLYVVGYLIFDLLTAEYYASNAGSATNAFRQTTLQWPLAVGNLAFAALITLGIMSRSSSPTIAGALVTGAVIGFLAWLSVDLVLYGYTNLISFTLVIVDPILEAIHNGIGGAAIAFALTRVPKGAD